MLGIQKMTDVRVPTRDGSYLLADVFRPIDEGSHPVVLTATAYGKAFVSGCICSPASLLQKEQAEDAYFEYVPRPGTPPRSPYEVLVTPNSVDWVPHGYVIMRIDGRGSCNTPGTLYPYSVQEGFDNYDAIEWAAGQRWSNGNVGMWGQSFSASIQFNVASLQPPHLKAMMPTSNDPDQYRDIVFQGGLYYRDYRESWFYGNVAARTLRCLDQPFVDIVSIFRTNPFADPRVYGPITVDPDTGRFLPTGQVSADLSRITIPIWSVERQDIWPIHVRGPSEAYLGVASRNKHLSVEAGDEFSRAYEPATVAMHRRFFDRYLRGERREDVDLPPVIVDFRLPNGGWTTRWEEEWPLARTQYLRWYLDATDSARGGTMSRTAPTVERSTRYSADAFLPNGTRLPCSAYGVSFTSEPLAEDTVIGGYIKLGLRVSSTSADMDIFATLRVLDENGTEVHYNSQNSQPSPVSLGFLKVSHRREDPTRSTPYRPWHTHTAADYQPLRAGEIVPVDVEIWPATAVLRRGYRLLLDVQPYDGCYAARGGPNGVYLHGYDASYHQGATNTLYTGGVQPSYLQLPIIPMDLHGEDE
jgi:putative CocE/NonD family hydrolase